MRRVPLTPLMRIAVSPFASESSVTVFFLNGIVRNSMTTFLVVVGLGIGLDVVASGFGSAAGFEVVAGPGVGVIAVWLLAMAAGSATFVVPVGPQPVASAQAASRAPGASAARKKCTVPPAHRRFPPRQDCQRPDVPGIPIHTTQPPNQSRVQ